MIVKRKHSDTYPEHFDVKQNGAVIDIASCTFKLTVDPRKDPPDTSLNLFVIPGVIEGPSANGRVRFDFTLTEANHLGKFYYDIQMIDAAGYIRTIEKDKWTFVQDITKATS